MHGHKPDHLADTPYGYRKPTITTEHKSHQPHKEYAIYKTMTEKTFAIIKPDAVAAGHTGPIINLIELNKFSIVRMQKAQLTPEQVETFYQVHKERSFFRELVDYMLSGPVVIMALEKNNAIAEWRDLMGKTNPKEAAPGTLRYMFGTSIGNNATHGSDSAETSKTELKFFFPDLV